MLTPPPRLSALLLRDRLRERLLADPRITDPRWAAYLLATVQHETAGRYAPIREFGTAERFTALYERNRRLAVQLGNDRPGDGARYCGRGYVQITGRANYRFAATRLLVDLEGNPDLALQPDIAYDLLVLGTVEGWYTRGRHKLATHIEGERCDWINARRIINGVDRAVLIAGYAEEEWRRIESILLAPEQGEPS